MRAELLVERAASVRRGAVAVLSAGVLAAAACNSSKGGGSGPIPTAEPFLLPTSQMLSPAGDQVEVGAYPLGVALSAAGSHALVTSSSIALQHLTLVDVAARQQAADLIPVDLGTVVNGVLPNGLFLGVAMTRDGKRAFAAGGGLDVVFDVAVGPTSLGTQTPSIHASGFPAGLALSADESRLYVALNLAGRVAAIDVASKKVVKSVEVGEQPWTVAVDPSGKWVYAACRGDGSVSQIDAASFTVTKTVHTGAHPTALAVTPDGSRLFVANTNSDTVSMLDATTLDALGDVNLLPFDGAALGGSPDAMAMAPDGRRLYVALGWDNALAVIDPAHGRLLGHIPTGWYPSGVAVSADSRTLVVTNMKGARSYARTKDEQPADYFINVEGGGAYLVPGTLEIIPAPDAGALSALSKTVASNDGWDTKLRPGDAAAIGTASDDCSVIPCEIGGATPIEHVVYVMRENKTYDEEFGDFSQADGDSSLTLYPRNVSPNSHALAEHFVLMDQLYALSENSRPGHQWMMAAISPDYVEKTWTSSSSSLRARPDDAADPPVEPIVYPESGYLFDNCIAHGVPYRSYGGFVRENADGTPMQSWAANNDAAYVAWDLATREQVRFDEWKREFDAGIFPRFEFVYFPNDHTAGAAAGYPSPQYMVAENDSVTGRLVDTISHSPFWGKTVIFVIEDDSQSGGDHVDSHRTIGLVIGPHVKRSLVTHERFDMARMVRTIEALLGLPPMTRFDSMAAPMRSLFTATPDVTPYDALPIQVPLEMNTLDTPGAAESAKMDFSSPDRIPDMALNRVLWKLIRRDSWPPKHARFSADPD